MNFRIFAINRTVNKGKDAYTLHSTTRLRMRENLARNRKYSNRNIEICFWNVTISVDLGPGPKQIQLICFASNICTLNILYIIFSRLTWISPNWRALKQLSNYKLDDSCNKKIRSTAHKQKHKPCTIHSS